MNLNSIKNQLTFLLAPRPLPLQKPIVIQFPVNDICNSRCQMCRIWKKKQCSDITVDELRQGLKDPLFSEVEFIGFNGGEPTLRRDLPELVKVVTESLPRLRSVSLITNGFKHLQVINQIEAIGNILKPRGIYFDVMLSLDGYDELHDRVRGRAGNFRNAQHVIRFIKSSSLVDNIRIGCTVIRENVNNLPELLEFCIHNDLYIKYRLGIPHQRLYTEDLRTPYALNTEEKYELAEFLEGLIEHYEKDPMQRFFYRSLTDQIIKGEPRKAGCDWKHRGATITARGELAYCAVKSKVLSTNIAEGKSTEDYFSNHEHLNFITNNYCDNCNHDYVGIPSREDYRKIFLQTIDRQLSVKTLIKRVPGFDKLHQARKKLKFRQDIKHYQALTNKIRLSESGAERMRILICGWYGTETLGDKAIIAALITSIRRQLGNNTNISIASINSYVTEMTRRQMPELSGVDIVSIEEAITISGTVDYLVFGGGPLMAIESLAPMQVLFERARAANATTIAAGVGVGPLGGSWLNDSIRKILKSCDTRIYRDEKSMQNAFTLGIDTSHDFIAEDPAFTWLKSIQNREFQQPSSQEKTLLLGLRDFPYREYAAELPPREALALKNCYEQAVIEALQKLNDTNKNLIIRPLPMCTNHFGGDDRWFYRRLLRDLKQNGVKLDYSLLGPEKPPLHYAFAYHEADALLGMRFHSLVFGIGMRTNCVAIDYTLGCGKVTSLSEKHSLPILPMKGITSDTLAKNLQQALEAPRPGPLQESSLLFPSTFKRALENRRMNNTIEDNPV